MAGIGGRRTASQEYGRKRQGKQTGMGYIPDEDNTPHSSGSGMGKQCNIIRDGGDGKPEVMESGEPVLSGIYEAGKSVFITEITRGNL